MLDRASTFAQPEIVQLLKTRFVPVAIDQANQRRQQDTEGEFYRKIAGQSPRSNFRQTTQGFYIATPSGKLLLYNNNRNPVKLLGLMKQKLADWESNEGKRTTTEEIEVAKVDQQFSFSAPEGGLILRVHAKVLDGYPPTSDRWKNIFQTALSRDNLWVSRSEHRALVRGSVPLSLQQRIAKFHLVDNTRGEPPMWRNNEIKDLSMKLDDDRLIGHVSLVTNNGKRGYDATLKGEIVVKNDRVVQFDMVCLGQFWGAGRYTGGAPKGKFPLAVTFSLADGSDLADGLQPQGSRHWLEGYLKRGDDNHP